MIREIRQMDKMERRLARSRFNGKKCEELASVGMQRSVEKKIRAKERASCLITAKVETPIQLLEQFKSRLQSIEDDTRHMKRVLVSCAQERSAMMSEIAKEFQAIRERLSSSRHENSSLGLSSDVDPPHKDGRRRRRVVGLSEVLVEDSNPTLVTRDTKVNLDASQELCRTS